MGPRNRPITPQQPTKNRLRRAFSRPTPEHDPIATLRRRARKILWLECLAQAVTPAACCLLAYLAAALFGLASPWLFLILLLCAAAALTRGLLTRQPPTDHAIDQRIEAASGLKHRPFAALNDEPEDQNPIALALWRAHQQRSLKALETARIGPPSPAAAAADPWSLRALLTLLIIAGLIIAGPNTPARLSLALTLPAWPFPVPTVTAWLTPPAYTGQPPQILTQGQTITALPGATLTIITNGPASAPEIRLAGTTIRETALSPTSHRADATVRSAGALLVGPWWHRLASWRVSVIPPSAPSLTLKTLTLTKNNLLHLTFAITDPYGLKTLTAALLPAGHPTAIPESFTLTPATGEGAATIDLTSSPFFLIPETLRLSATNEANITTAVSFPAGFTFTGLALTEPTAAVLNIYRQHIALTPHNTPGEAAAMRALAAAPPSHITAAADLKLAALSTALSLRAITPETAIAALLPLIQEIEAGPDFAPQQALKTASQALTSALQRALTGHPLDQATLQKLIAAMQQALAAHLAAQQPTPPSGQPPPAAMDTSALTRMAQKIAADEAAGRTGQAARELAQLQKLLAELAQAKPMTAAQMAQSQAAAAAAQNLAQMTQGEANLLNQTQQGTGTPATQSALQKQLAQTQAALAAAKINLPGLQAAAAGMQAAKNALAQSDSPAAQSQENAAIAGLQKAAAALSAAQSNSFSISPQQPGAAPGTQDNVNGGPDDQTTPLDLASPENPARTIEQQIIQQDSAPNLPPATHGYYHRLLQGGAQ